MEITDERDVMQIVNGNPRLGMSTGTLHTTIEKDDPFSMRYVLKCLFITMGACMAGILMIQLIDWLLF